MSDQFPSLAAVVAAHRWVSKSTFSRYRAGCSCGWERDIVGTNRKGLQLHGEHVEQVWREACTVTTVAGLNKLPGHTVIMDADDAVLRQNPWCSRPGRWYPLDGFDAYDRDFGIEVDAIPLPARVIHHPDWETK